MPRATRAVSRKDFLRLSGAGLAGAVLLGTTGCGGGQGGGEVIKYLTETPETTNLERTAIEIQVNRFEEQNPKYTLERETVTPDDLLTVIKTRLQSGQPPDVFNYGTGPGFAGVLQGGTPEFSGEGLQGKRLGDLRLGQAAGHLRRHRLRRPRPTPGDDRLLQQGSRARGTEDRG